MNEAGATSDCDTCNRNDGAADRACNQDTGGAALEVNRIGAFQDDVVRAEGIYHIKNGLALEALTFFYDEVRRLRGCGIRDLFIAALQAAVKTLRREGKRESRRNRRSDLCVGAAENHNEAVVLCGFEDCGIGREGIAEQAFAHGDREENLSAGIGICHREHSFLFFRV